MQLQRLFQGLKSVRRLPELARCRALVPEWKKLSACYLGVKTSFPFTIHLASGPFTFETVSDVRTFWVVWFANAYPVLSSDRLIVDAGANIGTFTLFALAAAPQCRVIAIEPAPDSFDRLASMISAHRLTGRCTLLKAALGKSSGTCRIDLRAESQFRRTGTAGVETSVLTLPDVISEEVDLLKMDIEGAELDAISAPDSLRLVRRVAMEFHPPIEVDDLTHTLEHAGFANRRVRHDGAGYGLLWATPVGTRN